jgi:hypothetical protein
MTWEKGQSGNPAGRVKGDARKELEAAIKAVEKKKGKNLLQHFVEQAFTDRQVLIAVMKKWLPDLKAVETDIKGMKSIIINVIADNGKEADDQG